MRSRKTILACSSLAVLQVLAALGYVSASASAQADQLVAVVIGEKSREACEVQSRRSDGNWGPQTLVGPPVACEGGVVSALITTQAEASHHVARTEVTAESEETSVVPLTGDPAVDEAAIMAEVASIHASFAGGVSVEEEASLGFMAPGALQNLPIALKAPSASVPAAKCKTGSVGQLRMRQTRWRSPGTQAVAYAAIYYKRISCARWKIT